MFLNQEEDEYTVTFNGGFLKVTRNTGEIFDTKQVFWLYDDVARIFEENRKSGLPLDAICEGNCLPNPVRLANQIAFYQTLAKSLRFNI